MPIRKTQRRTLESVLEQFHDVHGDRYDYSMITSYKNGNTKVPIVCRQHGIFYQLIRSHYSRVGCPKCSVVRVSNANRADRDEFISKIEEKYPGSFTFNRVVYKNSATKVVLTCKTHGDIEVKPRVILSGKSIYGCKFCYWDSKKISLSEFLERASIVHSNRYDYSSVTSLDTTSDKVVIMCLKHGRYTTTASIHLAGFNCPMCQRENLIGGYSYNLFDKFPERRSIGGTMYLVEFSRSDGTQFLKIGITTTMKTRFNGYKDYILRPIIQIETTIYNAFLIEQHVLGINLRRHVPKEDYFAGRYECFESSELSAIKVGIEYARNNILDSNPHQTNTD